MWWRRHALFRKMRTLRSQPARVLYFALKRPSAQDFRSWILSCPPCCRDEVKKKGAFPVPRASCVTVSVQGSHFRMPFWRHGNLPLPVPPSIQGLRARRRSSSDGSLAGAMTLTWRMFRALFRGWLVFPS